MCGIAGFFDPRGTVTEARRTAERMAAVIRHRGPDDEGFWTDPEAGIVLAHRRLAIIDLSAQGRQPMISPSGRYVIALNGEVYNFKDLRSDLTARGVVFRGHSDTEVLLAAIDLYGLETAVNRSVGMFAFALWDRSARSLFLVRDRLGKKPLYYAQEKGVFVFGSELRAIEASGIPSLEIDRTALTELLTYSCVPAPRSIYADVRKLNPGSILRVDATGAVSTMQYWSVPRAYTDAQALHALSPHERFEQLHGLLRDAVGLRMISDVPLGAFLSGGIDSSLVVALMQEQSRRPVKTFTIGFVEAGYDEAAQAAAVARHLGTHHTEMRLTAEEALRTVPRMPIVYDEPFADVSQIPTYLVACLARESVTVALSGDGGDEAFCGYNRYALGRDAWRRLSHAPAWFRRHLGRAVGMASTRAWNRLLDPMQRLLPASRRVQRPGEKLYKLARTLSATSPFEFYTTLVATDPDAANLVEGVDLKPPGRDWQDLLATQADVIEQMAMQDMRTYLPDDILVKVDRATMATSLEARAPLLDHRVVQFALGLPIESKVEDGEGKVILRQLLGQYIPKQLVNRPKAGFAVPIGAWLRGPLRDWAESLLAPERLRDDGLLRAAAVRRIWNSHLDGSQDREHLLWALLMFQAWRDHPSGGGGREDRPRAHHSGAEQPA